MFSNPELPIEQNFPSFPYDDPLWQELVTELGVQVDPDSTDDLLTEYTRYGIGWVERQPDYHDSFHDDEVAEAKIGALLSDVGLVDAIDPVTTQHDYALVDGGGSMSYDIRLARAEVLQATGKLDVSELVVFGGQRLRSKRIGTDSALLHRVATLPSDMNVWATDWITAELGRAGQAKNVWEQPFATERDLAILSLLKLYGGRLEHTATIPRANAASARIHSSIPLATTAADTFKLRDRTIIALNAPAYWREHAGRKLPVNEARPTGRSCFKEWLDLEQPPQGAKVILLTNQPSIYRSWLDLIIKAQQEERSDLRITAAGAGLPANATVGDVLGALGNLIISHHNIAHEPSVDVPESTPFVMKPRYRGKNSG